MKISRDLTYLICAGLITLMILPVFSAIIPAEGFHEKPVSKISRSSSDLIINEIMFDVDQEPDEEWVEIFRNSCSKPKACRIS